VTSRLDAPMSSAGRHSRLRLAIILAVAVVALAFVAVGVPMGIATLDQYGPTGLLFIFILPAIVLSLTLVGAFVAARVANPVGWLLELSGLAAAVGIFGGTYVNYDHDLAAGLPLVVPLAWLSSWTLLPAIGMLLVYVPMLFPSGRFLGPRWRALGLIGLLGVAGTIASGFTPGPLSSTPWIENPVGIPGAEDALAVVSTLSNLATPFVFGGAVISVFVRCRRADTVERQQLKWFGLVAGIAVVAFVISIPNNGPVSDIAWEVGLATLVLLPTAIGIAILRYRLWDIDRIVSRTIAWVVITSILAAVFAGLIVGLQAALAPVTASNSLAVAASTLVAAALFQPLRRRVQTAVDRRFNRSRYDAERTVGSFAEHLRGVTDLTQISDGAVAAVVRSLSPNGAAVWIRSRREGDA